MKNNYKARFVIIGAIVLVSSILLPTQNLNAESIKTNQTTHLQKISTIKNPENIFIKKDDDKLLTKIVEADKTEGFLSKTFKKLKNPTNRKEWWKAVLGIITLTFYFIIISIYGYYPTMKKIITKHVPVNSKSFAIFGVASLLSTTNAILNNSYVNAFALGLLASYAFITVGLNINCEKNIKSGKWKPIIDGLNDNKDFINDLSKIYPYSQWSNNGKVEEWSDKLEKLLGYTADELNNSEDSLRLLYPDQKSYKYAKAQLNIVHTTGEGYEKTFTPTSKSGKKIKLTFFTIPIIVDQKIIGTKRFVI